MTPENLAHLSQEQINDCLIGLSSAESAAHLAACPRCRRQVDEFQSQMKSFNQTTLAWSEARPLPMHVSHRSKARQALGSLPTWALAAAVLIAIGIPALNYHRDAQDHPGIQVSTQEETEAQIAQDNDLLRAVNVALDQREESPIREYHLSEAPRTHLRKRPELRK